MRDRALFDLAIDSKLWGCDLVKIKIGTLVAGPTIRSRSMVIQQKMGRPVQFEITSDKRASLLAWLERRGGTVDDFAIPSRVNADRQLSTRQYARLVDEWVTAMGLTPQEYGTHSLRSVPSSLLAPFAQNTEMMLALHFVQGVGIGTTRLFQAVLRNRYSGSEMGEAMSFFLIAFLILPVVAH